MKDKEAAINGAVSRSTRLVIILSSVALKTGSVVTGVGQPPLRVIEKKTKGSPLEVGKEQSIFPNRFSFRTLRSEEPSEKVSLFGIICCDIIGVVLIFT